MENCNCHNEIILKGSGQLERYLEALDPSYVSIDGRNFEDMLVFAQGYADQIRFYDMPGSQLTDPTPAAKVSWLEFFKRDMAVIASSVASVDLDQIKSDYDALDDQILANPTAELYTALLNKIAAIAQQLDQWYSIAIPENPLYNDINLAIKSTLSAQLQKAVAYEEGYIVVDSKTVLNVDYTKMVNTEEWGLNNAVNPEFDIYAGTTPEARILNAVPYVDDIFQSFFSVISNIVDQAPGYLQFAVTKYPSHQPYMALYITFLKLFSLVQHQMNGLTGKMLDFYYRDVLRLAPKPAVPDKVYLVFQLAKNVAEYDLPQGTALTAGKDASGKDQVYKTQDDFVINQAVVTQLKNIFIDKTPATSTEGNKTISSLYANPVANSLDGNGAKFTDLNPKWLTFGSGPVAATSPKNICDYISQKQAALNPPNSVDIGFAIASPQLVLQGGNRLIQVQSNQLKTLFADATLASNIQVALTGAKGWLTVSTAIDNTMVQNGLTWLDSVNTDAYFDPTYNVNYTGFIFSDDSLYIYLPVAEQAIVPFNAKIHTGTAYNTAYPVMQILVGPAVGLSSDIFHGLKITDLSISTRVGSINTTIDDAMDFSPNMDGLTTLIIQNDNGSITPGKSFDPYTITPSQGMSFYIGSQEVFNKPLGQLAVNIIKTQDLSSNNINWRAGADYEYRVNVLYNKSWTTLNDLVYGADFTQASLTMNILDVNTAGSESNSPNLVQVPLDREPIEYFTSFDINADKGFLRIDNLVATGADMAGRLQQSQQLQIKQISVSYLSTLKELDATIDQFFHIYPFGSAEIFIYPPSWTKYPPARQALYKESVFGPNPLLIDAGDLLLPQFTYLSPSSVYTTDASAASKATGVSTGIMGGSYKYSGDSLLDQFIYDASGLNNVINGSNNQYSGTVQEEGMLYIGLQNLQPLQTLSLLFEFAPGSAADEDDPPPSINWSYLIYNEWRPLNAENIIYDSTYGFQTTGIIKIDVPADANDSHTIVSDGLYWFCASVTSGSSCIPQLINVIAQAAEAVFVDQGNSASHYDSPLPAGSISKLSVAVSQVSSVQQPYASFDGKHKEVGKQYYTRVSERLRHKGRAITAWDYEHLVLNNFPNVFKVKCITNTNPGCLCPSPVVSVTQNVDPNGNVKCCGPVRSAGSVLIVPVPNLKNINAINPLQPKTDQLTLIKIVNYLSPLTSPFVKVYAKNPVYEQVIVFFRVKFLNGIDKGYYLKKLNDDIVQYLTPWAFDQNLEADFGQKIYASAIINFLPQTGYVDFITDFLMGVCRNECCPPQAVTEPAVTADGFVNALNQVSGCDDIEAFLTNQGYFIGDVIAEPSTQMSLLVSAPKHIILLYEDPPVTSPCDRAMAVHKAPVYNYPPEHQVIDQPAESQVIAQQEAVIEQADTQNNVVANDTAQKETIAEPAAAVAETEKPNVIEEAIENFDHALQTQASKIAEKGKAAVKKAEDFFKNVVKGKSADQGQIEPGPEIKALPPPADKS